MSEYQLTDDATGMSVVVSSDRELTEQDVRASLGEARKTVTKSIADGSYRLDDETKLPLDKRQSRQKLQKYVGYAMGINPDEVDIDSGMGLWERTKLDLLPDEPSRMEYLEKKFGSDNVSALNIGGKAKMFYRDPKTKKMTMVDEMGASLADFTADIAGEAITTAGAVGGAVAGTILAPGVGTVAGATGGAALGGFLTGVTQDVVAEVATGQDIELGQKVKQRGLEAAIGVPIDLATAGVGRFLSKRGLPQILGGRQKDIAKEVGESTQNALDAIRNSEVMRDITLKRSKVPAALRGSQKRSEAASELAQLYPKSQVAKDLDEIRSIVGIFQNRITGQPSEEAFGDIARNIAGRFRTLIDDVSEVDAAAARQIEDGLSSRLQKMVAEERSVRATGERIRELLAPGVKQIEATNDANWKVLREVGEGVEVPIPTIIRAIDNATAQFSRLELPQAKAIVRDLKKIMKGKKGEGTGVVGLDGEEILGAGIAGRKSINFNEFKEITDLINDAVSRNKEAGFSTRERVATRILEGLQGGDGKPGLRGIIAGTNPQLGDALNNALEFYKNNLLATRRSAVGRTLREQLADPAITPRQVAELTIQDPDYIAQALRIARQSGGPEAKALETELRDLYLNKIGLTNTNMDIASFNFDADIVRELWGDRQVKALNELKSALQQKSKSVKALNDGKIKQEEVNELFSAFSTDERNSIIRKITANAVKRAEARNLQNKELIKRLLPSKVDGEWVEPRMTGNSFASFADDFINADSTQVKRAMEALRNQNNPEGLKAFQQEFISQFFARSSRGAQTAKQGAMELWNPQNMTAILKGKNGAKIKKNLREVLGEKTANEILAANELLTQASTFGGRAASGVQPRFSATGSGLQFYIVGDVLRNSRNRLLSWAYGSNMLAPMLNWMSKDVGSDVAEKNFQKVFFKLLGTEKGMLALAREAQQDPQFAQQIEQLTAELSQNSPE